MPPDWPCNEREYHLEKVFRATEDFLCKPSYLTKEILISLVTSYDFHEHTGKGRYRITAYQSAILNSIYYSSLRSNLPSVRGLVYETIAESTRMMRIMSFLNSMHPDGEKNAYPDGNPCSGLLPPLLLFHAAFQEYVYDRSKSLALHIIEVAEMLITGAKSQEARIRIKSGFTTLINDLSYIRGTKRDEVLYFNRDELKKLIEYEAKLMTRFGENPSRRPLRGLMMTLISNWVLKSRNGYNTEFVVKYVKEETAKLVAQNDELWMHSVSKLNDAREGVVVPELLRDSSWIEHDWARGIELKPTRVSYVSSFSKNPNSDILKERYGSCQYGFKGDRMVDLLAPIAILDGKAFDAQTIVFDVLYGSEEAKKELSYLFSLIDLLPMSSEEKHGFLEEILQYWILSVKDRENKDGVWDVEQERRAVLFVGSGKNLIETSRDDEYFRMKTGMFMFPDYILGENPCREYLYRRAMEKRRATSGEDCIFCRDCLSRDYDQAQYGEKDSNHKCSVCGSRNVEVSSVPGVERKE